MRLFAASIWLSVLHLGSYVDADSRPRAERQLRPRDYDNRDYYALHISPDVHPRDVAEHFGLELEGPLGSLQNHHLFSTPKSTRDIVAEQVQDHWRRRKRDTNLDQFYDSILLAEKQRLKKLVKRSIPPRKPEEMDKDAAALKAVKTLQKSIMKEMDINDPIFPDQWHLVIKFS